MKFPCERKNLPFSASRRAPEETPALCPAMSDDEDVNSPPAPFAAVLDAASAAPSTPPSSTPLAEERARAPATPERAALRHGSNKGAKSPQQDRAVRLRAKVCPLCKQEAPGNKKFCSWCATKLEEKAVAQRTKYKTEKIPSAVVPRALCIEWYIK